MAFVAIKMGRRSGGSRKSAGAPSVERASLARPW